MGGRGVHIDNPYFAHRHSNVQMLYCSDYQQFSYITCLFFQFVKLYIIFYCRGVKCCRVSSFDGSEGELRWTFVSPAGLNGCMIHIFLQGLTSLPIFCRPYRAVCFTGNRLLTTEKICDFRAFCERCAF